MTEDTNDLRALTTSSLSRCTKEASFSDALLWTGLYKPTQESCQIAVSILIQVQEGIFSSASETINYCDNVSDVNLQNLNDLYDNESNLNETDYLKAIIRDKNQMNLLYDKIKFLEDKVISLKKQDFSKADSHNLLNEMLPSQKNSVNPMPIVRKTQTLNSSELLKQSIDVKTTSTIEPSTKCCTYAEKLVNGNRTASDKELHMKTNVKRTSIKSNNVV
ncbi:hypothetical protein FQR65_LT09471 [Abscondita terminalis]|nr:hypothetical protein FQR65_LT09471 [Abscondita terminalis]